MTVPSARPRRQKGAPFWDTVDMTGECWLWTASQNGNGYGQFWTGSRAQVAHRYAWELERGPIPEGLELHHLCHVRHCVRLDHLQMVTRQEHRIIEGLETTHCPAGHEYTDDNILWRKRNGRRQCKTCHREREALARKEGRRG